MLTALSSAAWRAPISTGPLLPATQTILGAVDQLGNIDARRWSQRVRHHGTAPVFHQLWGVAQRWPTSSRIHLYASFLQHRTSRLTPDVLAGAAADMTAAMIRTPDRARRDHIRYVTNACVEWHLRRLQATPDVYARTYLAIWARLSEEVFTEGEQLLLWSVIARTVQRAPTYWPASTRSAMMADIWAVVLDEPTLALILVAAFLLVAAWSETEDVPRVSRVVRKLASQLLEGPGASGAWRLVLEDALAGCPWPPDLPRLTDDEKNELEMKLWNEDA